MKFFRAISDCILDIYLERSWGTSWRFIIANLILREELRETVSFARCNIESAIRYMNINSEYAKRKLNKSYKDLSYLGEFKNIDIME